jgi:hypothetical protein
MWWKQLSTYNSFSIYVKCGAIFLLLLLSVLIVACGGSGTDNSLGQPKVTVTVNLGQNGSPPPPLSEYTCSAWVNNTTPGLNMPVIGVYAKYIHNVNGNPEGVGQVLATAVVNWYDGNASTITATTTSDGLAVFPVSTANRAADLGKIVRVTVTFQASPNAPACTVDGDRAAFFSLIIAASSPTSSPVADPTALATGTPCPSPGVSAQVLATPLSTVTPSLPTKKPPTPGPKPTPCH